jgi:CBS domain-containing membrane protein
MAWFNRYLPFLSIDPVNLGIGAKFAATVACFISIWTLAEVSQALHLGAAQPLIIASMGASAVIVFFCRTARWPSPGRCSADT